MPHWRTFTSGTSTDDADSHPVAAQDSAPRATPSWQTALATAMGGAAAGAAVVLLAATLTAGAPGSSASTAIDTALAGQVADMDALVAVGAVPGSAALDMVSTSSHDIVVDVAGAVARPGLHRVQDGGRVGDAIAAAGGFGPRVDLAEAGRSLNLAQPLTDGDKVLVPALGMEDPREGGSGDGRMDVNTADQAELESLPGIGPVTAARIIEARSQQPFRAVADLLARGVVGQAVYEDIEGLIRTSG